MTLNELMQTIQTQLTFTTAGLRKLQKQDDTPPTIHRCSYRICRSVGVQRHACNHRIYSDTCSAAHSVQVCQNPSGNVVVIPVRCGPSPIPAEDGKKHLVE